MTRHLDRDGDHGGGPQIRVNITNFMKKYFFARRAWNFPGFGMDVVLRVIPCLLTPKSKGRQVARRRSYSQCYRIGYARIHHWLSWQSPSGEYFHHLGFRTAGTGARTDPPPGPRPCRAELTSVRTPFLDRSKGLLPLSRVSCNASSCWASSRAWKLGRGNRQEFLTIVLLRGPSSTLWRVAESSVSHAVRSTNRGVRSRIVIR